MRLPPLDLNTSAFKAVRNWAVSAARPSVRDNQLIALDGLVAVRRHNVASGLLFRPVELRKQGVTGARTAKDGEQRQNCADF